MATKINREDAKTCFECDSRPPSYRLISLETFLMEDGSLEPDCLIGLFCEACLRLQIDDLLVELSQTKAPAGSNETPDSSICRQVGFVVVPIKFSERESQLLIDELGVENCETIVN